MYARAIIISIAFFSMRCYVHSAFFESDFTPVRSEETRYFIQFRNIQYDLFRKNAYTMFDFYQLGTIAFYREVMIRNDITLDAIMTLQQRTHQFVTYTRPIKVRMTNSTITLSHGQSLGRGTCFFLTSNIILTAGHNISGSGNYDPHMYSLTHAIYLKEQTIRASLIQYEYTPQRSKSVSRQGDWAILRTDEKHPYSPLPLITPRVGMTVIFMGFPRGEIGLGTNFYVENCNPETTINTGRLTKDVLPIPFAAIVESTNDRGQYKIRVVAGAEGMPGLSGGPVFDLSGAVVGIIVTGQKKADEVETLPGFFPAEEAIHRCKGMEGGFDVLE